MRHRHRLHCAVLAAALGAACGSERAPSADPGAGPAAGSASGSIDLLGVGREAWFDFDARAPGERVLLDASTLAASDWHGSVRIAALATPAELAAFEQGTVIHPDGSIEMRAPRGALVHFLALDDVRGPAVTSIEISGTITTQGLTGQLEDGYARVGIFQLDTDTWPGSPAGLIPHILSNHFDDPEFENSPPPTPVRLRVARDPQAKAIALVTEFIDERGTGDAAARFEHLRVASMGPAARALEVAAEVIDPGTNGDRARLARFDVDLVHRFGYALPLGARLVLPIDDFAGAGSVEFYVAALGHERNAEWTVDVTWADAGGHETRLARSAIALEADGDPHTPPAGWQRVVASLPEGADAGALIVAVEGTGREDEAWPTAPLVASPRLLPTEPTEDARPNVLVISLDTVRADRLGSYGGDPRLSGSFDTLAESSVLFADAWSTAPYTLPAHMSLFSGQYPSVHGVQRPSLRRDRQRTPMLAELLAERGYRTAAFTGGAMLLPVFGFAAGFERYGVLDPWFHEESERVQVLLDAFPGFGPRAEAASGIGAIEAQLDLFEGEPWLLFLHTYAAHEFDPPAKHLAAIDALAGLPADDPDIRLYLANGQPPPPPIRERLMQLYDGGVRHADELVGVLMELLRERGEFDNTIVVVLSDHGKEIGEHGVVGHGHTLYEELVEVPLLIHAPGLAPAVSNSPAQLVDVLPSLCGLLGIGVPAGVQGRDLFAKNLPGRDRGLWAEVDGVVTMRARREGSRKLIERLDEPGVEAFDLDRDPLELDPGAATPDALARLHAYAEELELVRRSLPSEAGAASALDAADRARLEALGYMVAEDGSFVPPPSSQSPASADRP
ncbi:sulfatase [Engelhardtia mirabilis]|uniref:Choline-sulfatase n=1 Tax=Engelhardtia mirabilis TaxID=2528011 RepID=A0A518BLK0_9BACT|nr:Choline-sulfatase [Planctomycetes bacterium Pla133]QDV02170.1 Choline-sulfatase [Planctomycetes bacterium Pla86]